MNKWLKILSWIIGALILLAVVLVVLANILITPDRVKGTLLPLAEKNLHRKIELGDIEVSFFSGIEIHGLKLYEKNSQDVFVSTDMVRLRYRLLPLLALKVVVDEVRLEKPQIRVVRLKDGSFNFTDLIGSANTEMNTELPSQALASDDKEGRAPINLLVSSLLLKDGQLVFVDHVLNNTAPYRYEITGLQIAAKGVSLAGEVPISLECQLNGSHLMLDGVVNLQPVSGNFEIELLNLSTVAFGPYFKDALPGKLGGATLSFKSNLFGTLDEVVLKGTVSLTELDLLLDAIPEAPLVNASLRADYDLLFASSQSVLQVRQFELDYNGIKVAASGEIASMIDNPTLDLTVAIPDLQIRQAMDAVPQSLVGEASDLDPAGSLTAEAVLFGGVDGSLGLLKSAKVSLDSVQATVGEHRPAFSGQLLLEGDQVRSEALRVRLGDNNADIQLEAKHIFDAPVNVTADITSERFFLEPLMQGSAAPVALAEEARPGSVNSNEPRDELGPFNLPVHASGTIRIDEAIWKDLTLGDFVSHYELKDNILSISRADGRIAGGAFRNRARVDLGRKGFVYNGDIELQAIQADSLMTAFVPESSGSLLGTMDLALNLDGHGTQWETVSQNLSGVGNMRIENGQLHSPELVNGLSSFLQLDDLDDIQFENFETQFSITDGKIKVDSQMISERIKLFPKGLIGLDGSLDMAIDARLGPELSAKIDKRGEVTSYLADKDGWTRIPLLLQGDFSSPNFGLDPEGVKEQATEVLTNELGRQLDKLFKNPSRQSGKDSEADVEPAQKLLQDSLQKLFGN